MKPNTKSDGQERVAELLSKYLDARQEGRGPRLTKFLEECPQAERRELREAIELVECFAPSPPPSEARVQETMDAITGISHRRIRIATAKQRLADATDWIRDPVGNLRAALDLSADRLNPAYFRGAADSGSPLRASSSVSLRGADASEPVIRDAELLLAERVSPAPENRAAAAKPVLAELERRLEERAGATLRDNDVVTAPIDLDDLADALSIVVTEAETDGLEGCLITDGEVGAVLINSAMTDPRRRRFTLAHEIGHFVLHAGESVFQDAQAQLSDYNTAIEQEANLFASRLLMPEFLLADFAPRLRSEPPSFELADRLSEQFRVSVEAALRRVVRLSSARWALVISHNGVVKQFERSPSLGCRVRGRKPVPEGSASELLRGAGPGRVRVASLPATAWFGPPSVGDEPGDFWHPQRLTAKEVARCMENGYIYALIVLSET